MTRYVQPSGPGVRVDSGVVAGDVIGGAFDSMLAKLIVTGRDRTQALERARRALAEYVVEGMPTVLPVPPRGGRRPGVRAGRPVAAVLRAHAVDRDRVRQHDRGRTPARPPTPGEPDERQTVVVEVGGKRLEVSLPGGLSFGGGGGGGAKKKAPRRSSGGGGGRRRLR